MCSLAAAFAQVAQLVEQRTENPRVAGSTPALGTTILPMGNDSKTDEGLAGTATAPLAASTEPNAPPASQPQELGRYRIEKLLGTGGMGVVYCAFDPDLERRVALKVLPDGTRAVVSRERLLREARAMARLNHPNVITVFEVG